MMKTNEYFREVKNLGYFIFKDEVDSSCYHIKKEASRNGITVAIINTKRYAWFLFNSDDRELLEETVEYSLTPIDEREEEDKYVFTFNSHAIFAGAKALHLRVVKLNDGTIALDGSSIKHALINNKFHFTEREIEKLNDKDRALIQLCHKQKVMRD